MDKNCLFCNQPLKNVERWQNRDACLYTCHNCGEYALSGTFKASLAISPENKAQIASVLLSRYLNLTEKSPVALIDKKLSQGDVDGIPLITIDEILDQFPKRVDEKINRALQNLGKRTKDFGQIILVKKEDCPLFYAKDANEMLAIIDELLQSNYLKKPEFRTDISYVAEISVTAKGFDRIYELDKVNPTSRQGFVAMWFPDPIKEKTEYDNLEKAYDEGFEKAIKNAGYESMKINKKEFSGKIDDEIIAEVKRSRFLVADFTTDCKKGQRGGVYYEAGFAHGLNIPVIYTCRQDCIDYVHFDTRQYNHIVWTDAADLYVKLFNRIGATIGQGPKAKKEESK